jgi:hypothetical protein
VRRWICQFAVASSVCALSTPSFAEANLEGLIQVGAVIADPKTSFMNKGTGALRYDDSGITLQQALLRYNPDLSTSLSADIVLNAYSDGEQRLGFTQASLKWKPLSASTLRWKGRAGFFYPRMSSENADIGWLSPYSYTPSAINSWIGEELRILGAEASVFSPGRSRRSAWSWEATAGLFGSNDPTGTLLSWRGFALTDRQSLHHDRVEFAPIPAVIDRDQLWSKSWVEPFEEIDDRIGHYVGGHLRFRNRSDIRLYYYDNNADPSRLNKDRLYAWDTRFTSLAARHDLSPTTRLLAQWMRGSSEMGPDFVDIDFDSYYLLLSHRRGASRFSLRYDRWDVRETDSFEPDPNDSDGDAVTLAWRWDTSDAWQIGLEYIHTDNVAANRITVGEPAGARQQQVMAVAQYRFSF